MNRIRKLCALLVLILPGTGTALDWPIADAPIALSFGQNQGGRPNLRIDFTGTGLIRAAEAGEVVFVSGPSSDGNDFPSGLGQWLAIDHRDSLFGIYAGLRDVGNEIRTNIEKGEILGLRADDSKVGSFHFAIYDAKENRWINPVIIFGQRPDKRPPVIREVILKASDGAIFNPAIVKTLRQGSYSVIIEASDTEDATPTATFAPFRLACSVNGSEVLAVNLEYFQTVDGRLQVSASTPLLAASIYASSGFTLGTIRLNRGRANLEINIRDVARNEKTAGYTLVVE